jgi:putative MATE family efflux protein
VSINDKRDNKQDRLGSDDIGKLLLQFSIPATIGMLVNALYNIVDRMFIGKAEGLQSLGLTALTVSFPIMMIMMGLALMFGAGGAALFSIKLGEKDKEGAAEILGNGIAMIFISSLLFMIIALWQLEPLLKLFGANDEVMPYAKEYMNIILYASIAQGPAVGCNHFMRADGSPKSAMLSMFIGAGFNIVFDYILIFIFHMGMTGAALATVGGQALSAIWGLSYFLYRGNIRLKISRIRLNRRLIPKIAIAGLPSFFNQVSTSIINIVLNKSLLYYGGNVAIAIMGAVTSMQQVITMPIVGINHGSQPIIGYNRGAKHYKRIRETLIKAITAATTLVVIGYIITRIFPSGLIRLFGNEEEFINLGSEFIKIWFLLLPVVGFQMIGALYFQSVGKPKVSLFLTLTRQLIFLIPLIILLSIRFGLNGILYAGPLADGLSFLVTAFFIILEFRRLNGLIKNKESVIK